MRRNEVADLKEHIQDVEDQKAIPPNEQQSTSGGKELAAVGRIASDGKQTSATLCPPGSHGHGGGGAHAGADPVSPPPLTAPFSPCAPHSPFFFPSSPLPLTGSFSVAL